MIREMDTGRMTQPIAITAYLTKTEIILDVLRQRVMSGVYVPGQRLVLRTIANEFSCSDIPVREAMRSLAAEQLVTIAPHEGARVTHFDSRELVEQTQARSLLEPEANVLAAPHMSEEDFASMDNLLSQMTAIVDEGAEGDYGRLNREFHRVILGRCPNRTIVQLIEDLWGKAERGRAVHRVFDGHLGKSLSQHKEIVRAMKAGDLVGLRKVSERHCAHGLEAVRRLCEEDKKTLTPGRPNGRQGRSAANS